MYPIPTALKPVILYDELWMITSYIRAQPASVDCTSLKMVLLAAVSIRKALVTFFTSSKIHEKMKAREEVVYHKKSIQVLEATLTTKFNPVFSQNAAIEYVTLANLQMPMVELKDFFADFTSRFRGKGENPQNLREKAKKADRLMRRWLLKRDSLVSQLNSINHEIRCLFDAAKVIGVEGMQS